MGSKIWFRDLVCWSPALSLGVFSQEKTEAAGSDSHEGSKEEEIKPRAAVCPGQGVSAALSVQRCSLQLNSPWTALVHIGDTAVRGRAARGNCIIQRQVNVAKEDHFSVI